MPVSTKPRKSHSENEEGVHLAAALSRALKIALVMLALLFAGLGLLVWLGADPSTLPLDYEGFD